MKREVGVAGSDWSIVKKPLNVVNNHAGHHGSEKLSHVKRMLDWNSPEVLIEFVFYPINKLDITS